MIPSCIVQKYIFNARGYISIMLFKNCIIMYTCTCLILDITSAKLLNEQTDSNFLLASTTLIDTSSLVQRSSSVTL